MTNIAKQQRRSPTDHHDQHVDGEVRIDKAGSVYLRDGASGRWADITTYVIAVDIGETGTHLHLDLVGQTAKRLHLNPGKHLWP